MAERYHNLEKALCKELDKLEKKYAGDIAEMSSTDAEKANMLYHALKSAETYHAMKDASEEMGGYSGEYRGGRSYDGGNSYARGRSRTTGRYISRDGGEGSEGGYSGHYPMYPDYPMSYARPEWDRRY